MDTDQSVEAISAIPARMNEAWNRADAAGFFADFADEFDFAEFEGTVFRDRAETIATQQQVFDTVMKGSRLVRGEVVFARIIRPGWGVVHHRMGILLPGEEEPLSSRYCMQLFVVVWQNERWEVTAIQNSRVVSLAGMMALDAAAAEAAAD